ncbi:MAG: pyridoxamine 5'-phosphate oxidase [Bacteroidales bacterium]
MEKKDLRSFRTEYRLARLDRKSVPAEPFSLFNQWLGAAIGQGLSEPNAMTLATVTPDGKPAARIVLLKEFIHGRFVFYTNYESNKGRELESNPNAALVFLWLEMQRQVRISGWVERVSSTMSDEYFAQRPKETQIGAVISPQSRPVSHRDELEKAFRELQRKNTPVSRPPHWGGYQLWPEQIEFWQGRENRLHDRILYSRRDKSWEILRLAP